MRGIKTAPKNQAGLYVYISLFWFALEFCWQGMMTVILPSRLLFFVSSEVKGTTLALLFSAGALISMLAQPVVGTLSDYSTHPLGRRRPFLIIGAITLSASLLIFGYAANLTMLFLSVILIFTASDLAQAPSQGFIPDLVPIEKRGKAAGLMGFSTILGAISGPLVAGFLLSEGLFMPAIYTIIFVLMTFMLITVIKVEERQFILSEALSFSRKLAKAFHFKLKEHPGFYWLQLARFFILLALTTLLVYFLYFLKDVIRHPEAERATGVAMALAALAALAAILPSASLSDRFGRKPLLYLAGGLAILATFPLFFARTYGQILVITSLFGLGFGTFYGAMWALNVDVIPHAEAGKYLGYTQFSTSMAQILAPMTGGPLIDLFHASRMGYNIIFGLALFYMVTGLLILRKVKEPHRTRGS